MAHESEVVITGVGVVSPIGIGKNAFWESLIAGRSGVRPLAAEASSELPVRIGAEVKDFDGKQYVKPRKSLKVMCREIQIGYSAAVLALEDARLNAGDIDPDRLGVVLGSEMFNCDLDELAAAYRKCMIGGEVRPDLWGEGAMSDLYPLWMLKYLPNMTACHIAIALDARGPNNTITMDEVSSLLAVIESVRVIQRGQADVMISGGGGSRVNVTRMLYRGDQPLSHRNDDPAAASRPFDARRDGGVVGEGAGALILESRRHAEARGAPILARIAGCGWGYEPCPDMQPGDGSATRQSIHAVMRDAGLTPAQIGHLNAHGTSMVERDRLEAQAIRDCLDDVPVTALKSYFGCLAAGSGAVELIGSVLALQHGQIPRTLNYEFPDPTCPVNVVREPSFTSAASTAIKLNQAETGQAVALVITAP